jgi:hypothetical protein
MLSRDVVKFILQNAVANVVFTKTVHSSCCHVHA